MRGPWEWCQDTSNDNLKEGGGKTPEEIRDSNRRVLRGGAFADPDSLMRASITASNFTKIEVDHYGFRVARTLPPGTFTALPLTSPKGSQ